MLLGLMVAVLVSMQRGYWTNDLNCRMVTIDVVLEADVDGDKPRIWFG